MSSKNDQDKEKTQITDIRNRKGKMSVEIIDTKKIRYKQQNHETNLQIL